MLDLHRSRLHQRARYRFFAERNLERVVPPGFRIGEGGLRRAACVLLRERMAPQSVLGLAGAPRLCRNAAERYANVADQPAVEIEGDGRGGQCELVRFRGRGSSDKASAAYAGRPAP